MKQRKIIAYMAMSIDGCIARGDGDTNWLSVVDTQGEDYGYNLFYDQIDTVLMGRKTYEKIESLGIDFPHRNKLCYVISSQTQASPYPYVEFYSGDLEKLAETLKDQDSDKHIMIDGGADLINELSRLKLIDEWVISIIPIILGGGVKLFKDRCPEQALKLINSQAYRTGLIQLKYEVIK